MFNINYFKNKFNEGLNTKLESSGGGLKVSINGGELKDVESLDLNTIFDGNWGDVSTLPYEFYNGGAILLNNEIHILGGYNSNSGSGLTMHYKYNTSTKTWSNVSTLPYDFYGESAIVLDNEIHILGGWNNYTKHYSISSLLSISKLIEKKTTS